MERFSSLSASFNEAGYKLTSVYWVSSGKKKKKKLGYLALDLEPI